jgi:DNA polymerase-4
MGLYVQVSREIRKILGHFSPSVEPLSIDEAFLDLTGIAGDLARGAVIGRALKKRIRTSQGLTASVGVASNKFLAKLASDLEKPDGLVVFPLEDVPRRLWPMPVERLWGVGPSTAARLHRGGIRTIGAILKVEPTSLERLVGPGGAAHLRALAEGRDDRVVVTEHRAKSISEERTYGEDLTDAREIDRALLARSDGVARQLRRESLCGRTVHIKVRAGDFTTWTRSVTLAGPTDLTEPIVEAARRLYRERIRLGGRGIRLLGVGVSGLEPRGRTQAALFEDPAEARSRRLAAVTDAVRDRVGERAVTRASLLSSRKPRETSSLPSVD